MVDAISTAITSLPQTSAKRVTTPADSQSVEVQSIAASSSPPVQTSDLLYKPGTFKDNETFAIVAESGATQEKQQTYKEHGGLAKFAKNAFDLFGTRQTGAQRQLQALLSQQTLNDLNNLLQTNTPTQPSENNDSATAGTGDTDSAIATNETEGAGDTVTDRTGGSTGETDTGTTDTGTTDTGGGTDTGDTGNGGPGNNGQGKGYGKGGINK